MVQCGSCQVPTTVQAFRNWWMKYRSSIAKVWLWASLVGVSVGFGFLWTYCNPPNFDGGACNPGTTNPECAPCGLVTHWLGIIFIFMIFFVYAIYSILKDCNCFIYGCFPQCRNGNRADSAGSTNSAGQVHPSSEEAVWESTAGFGLDLPSYEDALEMPKVESAPPKPKGETNLAYLSELPPAYTANDRIGYQVRADIGETSIGAPASAPSTSAIMVPAPQTTEEIEPTDSDL